MDKSQQHLSEIKVLKVLSLRESLSYLFVLSIVTFHLWVYARFYFVFVYHLTGQCNEENLGHFLHNTMSFTIVLFLWDNLFRYAMLFHNNDFYTVLHYYRILHLSVLYLLMLHAHIIFHIAAKYNVGSLMCLQNVFVQLYNILSEPHNLYYFLWWSRVSVKVIFKWWRSKVKYTERKAISLTEISFVLYVVLSLLPWIQE